MMCEVVSRLAGSFLEQSGWALINTLKRVTEPVVAVSLSLFPCLFLDSFFVSNYSISLSFIFHLFFFLSSLLFGLFSVSLLLYLPTSPPHLFHLFLLFSSSFPSTFLLLFSFLLFSLPHISSVCLRFHFHCEQIISSVSDKWHRT